MSVPGTRTVSVLSCAVLSSIIYLYKRTVLPDLPLLHVLLDLPPQTYQYQLVYHCIVSPVSQAHRVVSDSVSLFNKDVCQAKNFSSSAVFLNVDYFCRVPCRMFLSLNSHAP